MRNIKELLNDTTYFDVFLEIIDGDDSISKLLKDNIKQLYDNYEDSKYNLLNSQPHNFSNDEKLKLKFCYDSKKTHLVNLKNNIRNLDMGKCPYCGIDKSREVEHYLPRSEFPEYSVLTSNLIPSCGSCNGKKGNRWRDHDSRIFLHLYYDEIPTEQFLFTDLKIDGNTIESTFYLNLEGINVENDTAVILEKHIKRLDLLNRYSESIEFELTEFKFRIKESGFISKEDICSLITQEINTQKGQFGNNYWKSVLYRGCLENLQILEYFVSGNENLDIEKTTS